MATIAPRRPAWSLPATVAGSAGCSRRWRSAGLVLLSIVLRTRDFGVGFWIDEGLSVGIADRPLSDIPAALRLDGSPPLYYSLLHVWMAVFGHVGGGHPRAVAAVRRARRPGRLVGGARAVRARPPGWSPRCWRRPTRS